MLTLRSTSARYGGVAQGFHWLTVVLVLAAYLMSEGGPESRVYSAAFDSARRIHETLGIAVFAVVLLRLIWRMVDAAPPLHDGPPWMTLSARLVHFLLYCLLVAIPLTAILGTWFEGHPLTLLGVDVAPWIGPSRSLGESIVEIHETLGNVILWLAGLHAAAALVHHFYLRDAVLRSMIPGQG
jgi:cytochrome b561